MIAKIEDIKPKTKKEKNKFKLLKKFRPELFNGWDRGCIYYPYIPVFKRRIK